MLKRKNYYKIKTAEEVGPCNRCGGPKELRPIKGNNRGWMCINPDCHPLPKEDRFSGLRALAQTPKFKKHAQDRTRRLRMLEHIKEMRTSGGFVLWLRRWDA